MKKCRFCQNRDLKKLYSWYENQILTITIIYKDIFFFCLHIRGYSLQNLKCFGKNEKMYEN
jgi:hypothetical protein